jgi:hypothetical protein
MKETFSEATDIDYFLTNVEANIVTPKWVVETYSQRNIGWKFSIEKPRVG